MEPSGKRKREDFAKQYNNGGFIPQQDGAGDATFEVLQGSQGNDSLARTSSITTKRESLAHVSSSKIPQVDGPIPDSYDDELSTPNVCIILFIFLKYKYVIEYARIQVFIVSLHYPANAGSSIICFILLVLANFVMCCDGAKKKKKTYT
uniref:Uncharacterized protein n=1 Tax=Rhizophora mucronata TaxID=61149 RepID=A0A2P2LP78_RHIMU